MRIAAVLFILPILITPVTATGLEGGVSTDQSLQRKLVDESAFADVKKTPAPQRASRQNQAQRLQEYSPPGQRRLQGRASDSESYLAQPGPQQSELGYQSYGQPEVPGTRYQVPIQRLGAGYRLPLVHPPYALDICTPGRADIVAASLAIGLIGAMVKHHHHKIRSEAINAHGQ